MDGYRDSSSVVLDGDVVALFNEDFDVVAESGHGLVDGVVDNLVDQVVQAYDAGGTDVHSGPFADSIQTFEDLD